MDASGAEKFKPKNILVTGGAGFIASHMILYLLQTYPQYNVVNLDKMDYCSSTWYFKDYEQSERYSFVQGNILCRDFVNYVIKSKKIDTIMHFAAQSHVDNSFGNSIAFTENNVLGTHVLLECAKDANIKRFIHISTDEVYGETAYSDVTTMEQSLLRPTNPYAASKAAAEHLVQSFWKSFKVPLIITRSNNVFGPHQFPEKVIPKFISRLGDGLKCCLHGKGDTRRSFIYVKDAVRAFDLILHHGDLGAVYNVEAGEEISVLELARKIIKRLRPDCSTDEEVSALIESVEDRKFNDLRYNIDGSLLKSMGFETKWTFDEGLEETIEWYLTTDITQVWKPENIASAIKPHATPSSSSLN